MKSKVICVVMGGGQGKRLYPLTKYRCKPAASLGGKYRLVDIPISNCLNSGYNKIYVLSQFKTASLHQHIHNTYQFDPYGGGFIEILSPEQTEKGETWYQGTADAVRQNLHHFSAGENDLIIVLSGDQLYNMDLQEMAEQHRQRGAEVTIAAKAIPVSQVLGLGLMRIRDDLTIAEFVEKPADPAVIEGLAISDNLAAGLTAKSGEKHCLVNMGIYVFNKQTLFHALDESPEEDFGKGIIPGLVGRARLMAFIFEGYWEDIGTVRAFFEANLALTDPLPAFDLFNPGRPIFTHSRYLPPPKINRSEIKRSLVGDGSILDGAILERCIIGLRSVVREGTRLRNAVLMGNDFYETAEDQAETRREGLPDLGLGRNCNIADAIIDKNARVGDNVRLSPEGKPDMQETDTYMVRDGILIVHKGAVIPSGTVI